MSHTALYRKYRSKSLDEIVGQRHITDVLSRALGQGKTSHAYLLTGPRGVGKTSIARILAHEINQLPYDESLTHLDIIEIDAASNNGVDDVRQLRENVQLAPVAADKKIYIIDEVHMLSKPAFNALLKTLEEPPSHVVFILATTDADKLPATIVSRTQRFGFRRIGLDDMTRHLRTIAHSESITIDDDALQLIAAHGDGSFRDSINLLDQAAGLADQDAAISAELVENLLGLAPADLVVRIVDALDHHDTTTLIELLDTAEQSGISAVVLAGQLLSALRTQLQKTPQYSALIQSLIDVQSSPQPPLKLLSVLVSYIQPIQSGAPKRAALRTETPPASVAIPALEVAAASPSPAVALAAPAKVPKTPQSSSASKSKPRQKTPAQPRKPEVPTPATFDKTAFLDYAKTHFVAVSSVLDKCHYETNGIALIIYTGNAFYKKKLDDTKYLPHLYECLEHTGQSGFTIETIPTPPPLKDSQAAAVAAIMGGGEAVDLSE